MKKVEYWLVETNGGSQKCSSEEEARDWLGDEETDYRISHILKEPIEERGEYAESE